MGIIPTHRGRSASATSSPGAAAATASAPPARARLATRSEPIAKRAFTFDAASYTDSDGQKFIKPAQRTKSSMAMRRSTTARASGERVALSRRLFGISPSAARRLRQSRCAAWHDARLRGRTAARVGALIPLQAVTPLSGPCSTPSSDNIFEPTPAFLADYQSTDPRSVQCLKMARTAKNFANVALAQQASRKTLIVYRVDTAVAAVKRRGVSVQARTENSVACGL